MTKLAIGKFLSLTLIFHVASTPGESASLFLSSNVPANVNANDPQSVELGVKFRAATAGNITGFRFYKGSQDTGTHTAHLWTTAGTLLASATFTGESASGWQQVNLSSPVSITANTTYVASYHTNGRYAFNNNYFDTSRTNGPLTAPSSSSSGGNGVYVYGSTVLFPYSTYRRTNYWVDVVFGEVVSGAPSITSALTANATVGTPFSYQITATNSPTSFNATGLPAGLSVNTTTGIISGTPTSDGTFSITLTATNAAGPGSATLALTTAGASSACNGTYSTSGPIVASSDNQIISNLNITTTSGPGINTNGKSGVKIKNVTVHHSGNNPGILVSGGTNVSIVGADVINEAAPASGANSSSNQNNIACMNSSNIIVKNVRVSKGSSGVYLQGCSGSNLSFIEGHEHRGPFPRGQVVQWNASNNGTLTDFSTVNNVNTSWTEDNVNVYGTTGITIARGLVDGNNSPSGVGVIVDGSSGNVTVNDVDAIHQGNGSFFVYGGPGHDVTFTNVRSRDNHCSNPRGAPSSNGLVFGFDPAAGGNLNVVNSFYFNLCNPGNIVWDASKLTINQISQSNFTPRPPIVAKLCE